MASKCCFVQYTTLGREGRAWQRATGSFALCPPGSEMAVDGVGWARPSELVSQLGKVLLSPSGRGVAWRSHPSRSYDGGYV